MYCEKCGSQIDDDSVFCQKCGEKQLQEIETATAHSHPNKDVKKVLCLSSERFSKQLRQKSLQEF